jgi:predicted ATPase with chaperone activity
MSHSAEQECTVRNTCCYDPHGCPCGYAGDPTRECTCSASTIARYQKRISGPLLDRIDIHVEVPRVEYEQLTDRREGGSARRTYGRGCRRHWAYK